MTNNFLKRHIGVNDTDVKLMLDTVGVTSLDELIDKTIPSIIREDSSPDIGEPIEEHKVLKELKLIASENKLHRSLIGQGYYDTVTPNVILRNVLQNPGWYTAYTPYQPEVSQGRLEALLNFQQMVIDLTAMEIANASLLDEATAAAEAMTLAKRANKKNKSNVFLVSELCHPQTIEVIKTRARPLGFEVIIGKEEDLISSNGFALLLQYPATNGDIKDYEALVKKAHDKNIIVAVATDLLALTLLKPPGEWGADIVFGSAQRFGVPLGYGGPHAAFFAVREDYKRMTPGRIVGVSVDAQGNPALRLALQTREQHIRRDKATSNICTAQVLLANIAAFYAIYHGAEGLKELATRIHGLTCTLAESLRQNGFEIGNQYAFDTIIVKDDSSIMVSAPEIGLNFRDMGDDYIGISLDEKSTEEEIYKVLEVFVDKSEGLKTGAEMLPEKLKRKSEFLTHPNFNNYRSETEMMRYLRRLEYKDIALNRSMIPLGSCTMKLNAAVEMEPITWPEFSDIHPFVPEKQALGYKKLIDDLEDKLCKLTGFAAVSMQPNAGSQGEYAGLLAIDAYHKFRGDNDRNICLIPSSAHGTNPASAVMVGMKVVVVACDDNGNIDVEDLKAKAEEYKDTLAALMVTYPSTHGVFEESIKDVCEIIHDADGQVYMDGANFNAMVGFALPAKIGADVMHMNLHKTFAIPHGGGGPGVGPIGVAKHLKKFLPSVGKVGAVSAAQYGSASILPISWVYIALMSGEGLKRATEIAILNANYIAKKLEGDFDTLYKGKNGFIAHECIIDTRVFKESAGVSVDDIAKRLMDFGFHAPTMSFPVSGTLMIEPTESESKAELDRFIEAMKVIRQEIRDIEEGKIKVDESALHNSPHTAGDVVNGEWDRAYTREQAIYPADYIRGDKYWPPVNRIDHVTGDRNLICTCPDICEYE